MPVSAPIAVDELDPEDPDFLLWRAQRQRLAALELERERDLMLVRSEEDLLAWLRADTAHTLARAATTLGLSRQRVSQLAKRARTAGL